MAKIKQKLLHKVEEEHNLKPGEMIYLGLISQKKPGNGGSNNWILVEDLVTKKIVFHNEGRRIFD